MAMTDFLRVLRDHSKAANINLEERFFEHLRAFGVATWEQFSLVPEPTLLGLSGEEDVLRHLKHVQENGFTI